MKLFFFAAYAFLFITGLALYVYYHETEHAINCRKHFGEASFGFDLAGAHTYCTWNESIKLSENARLQQALVDEFIEVNNYQQTAFYAVFGLLFAFVLVRIEDLKAGA